MTHKIIARAVRKDYEVRDANQEVSDITVLQDFNLDIREGEFFSILGPSGCGKSTFLSILAGLTDRSGGSIAINDRPLEGINPNQGVVFQGYALFPWRTVIQNIAVGLEIRGVRKAERLRVAHEYLELVGLQGFADRYPHEISGGMKQRVAIARSLAYKPDVLLMDEPFAALDAQTREILQSELLRIWEQYRKTIVFITHSLDEAIFLSDRIAVMTKRPGTIKEIIDIDLPRPRHPEVRNTDAFVQLRQRAWNVLKDEVQLGQPGTVPQPLGATADPRERAEVEEALAFAAAANPGGDVPPRSGSIRQTVATATAGVVS